MSSKKAVKRFMLWFAQEHIPFRKIEFEGLSSLLNIKYSYLEPPSEKPYLMIETSCEKELIELMSRTVLARSLYELWCHSENYQHFYDKLRNCELTRLQKYANTSFRIQVEGFGKKLPTQLKVQKIENLSFLPFEGPIDLKNPENSFHLFEYYGNDCNDIPNEPQKILFGRWITDGHRKAIANLSLKRRKFIANTSMDTTLSLIMTNVAKITSGDLIFDPFVGSGSLLVAAAHFGAFVMGADIDYLLLHGLSKPTRCGVKTRESDENILSNLKQYGLQEKYIDIVVADSSLPLWRNDSKLIFDAIITDPPYGIRESRERIGTEKEYKIPENLLLGHIPSKIQYNLQDIIQDLLNFSAKHLKIGGRLLFWLPLNEKCNQITVSHPCLDLLSMSEQNLTLYSSRVLVVMEKKLQYWNSLSETKLSSDVQQISKSMQTLCETEKENIQK